MRRGRGGLNVVPVGVGTTVDVNRNKNGVLVEIQLNLHYLYITFEFDVQFTIFGIFIFVTALFVHVVFAALSRQNDH